MINYNRYLNLSEFAADDNEVFKNFKIHPDYHYMLEHVREDHGKIYIEQIKVNAPYLLQFLPKFITNDTLGNPKRYYYETIQATVSPTTLRYIKVLADICNLFGSLDDLDIVEIGVGYGGQCKIINDCFKPKSYTLIDLPGALLLSKRCLDHFKVKNVIYKPAKELTKKEYDFCISNYAFTEIGRNYQDFYVDRVISGSNKGYMTCNFMDQRQSENALSTEEIKDLKSDGLFLPEVPLTGNHNKIYVWNTNHKQGKISL